MNVQFAHNVEGVPLFGLPVSAPVVPAAAWHGEELLACMPAFSRSRGVLERP